MFVFHPPGGAVMAFVPSAQGQDFFLRSKTSKSATSCVYLRSLGLGKLCIAVGGIAQIKYSTGHSQS